MYAIFSYSGAQSLVTDLVKCLQGTHPESIGHPDSALGPIAALVWLPLTSSSSSGTQTIVICRICLDGFTFFSTNKPITSFPFAPTWPGLPEVVSPSWLFLNQNFWKSLFMKQMDSFILSNFKRALLVRVFVFSAPSISTADNDFALGLVRALEVSLFEDMVTDFKDSGVPEKGIMGWGGFHTGFSEARLGISKEMTYHCLGHINAARDLFLESLLWIFFFIWGVRIPFLHKLLRGSLLSTPAAGKLCLWGFLGTTFEELSPFITDSFCIWGADTPGLDAVGKCSLQVNLSCLGRLIDRVLHLIKLVPLSSASDIPELSPDLLSELKLESVSKGGDIFSEENVSGHMAFCE